MQAAAARQVGSLTRAGAGADRRSAQYDEARIGDDHPSSILRSVSAWVAEPLLGTPLRREADTAELTQPQARRTASAPKRPTA